MCGSYTRYVLSFFLLLNLFLIFSIVCIISFFCIFQLSNSLYTRYSFYHLLFIFCGQAVNSTDKPENKQTKGGRGKKKKQKGRDKGGGEGEDDSLPVEQESAAYAGPVHAATAVQASGDSRPILIRVRLVQHNPCEEKEESADTCRKFAARDSSSLSSKDTNTALFQEGHPQANENTAFFQGDRQSANDNAAIVSKGNQSTNDNEAFSRESRQPANDGSAFFIEGHQPANDGSAVSSTGLQIASNDIAFSSGDCQSDSEHTAFFSDCYQSGSETASFSSGSYQSASNITAFSVEGTGTGNCGITGDLTKLVDDNLSEKKNIVLCCVGGEYSASSGDTLPAKSNPAPSNGDILPANSNPVLNNADALPANSNPVLKNADALPANSNPALNNADSSADDSNSALHELRDEDFLNAIVGLTQWRAPNADSSPELTSVVFTYKGRQVVKTILNYINVQYLF